MLAATLSALFLPALALALPPSLKEQDGFTGIVWRIHSSKENKDYCLAVREWTKGSQLRLEQCDYDNNFRQRWDFPSKQARGQSSFIAAEVDGAVWCPTMDYAVKLSSNPGILLEIENCAGRHGDDWVWTGGEGINDNGQLTQKGSAYCLTATEFADGAHVVLTKCEDGNERQIWNHATTKAK